MNRDQDSSLWTQKGAALSDKTAQKEFRLTDRRLLRRFGQGNCNTGKIRYMVTLALNC